jgi:large subunit ribosomal protein L23
MAAPQDIIIKPLVTEKSTMLMEEKKYAFQVARKANKGRNQKGCGRTLRRQSKSCQHHKCSGKFKRMGVHKGYRPDWKKAMVTLTEESKPIEIFEGL